MSNTTKLTLQHIRTNKPPGSPQGAAYHTPPAHQQQKRKQPTTPLWAIGCTGQTHSPAATPDLSVPLWTTGCPGWTHSPATTPDLSRQEATQDGLTRLQPRWISMPLWTTCCPGRNHSPAASPDLHASPDSQLPRTDSLVYSSTRTPASSPTNYPGTQMPVAGRQRHIAPDHLACRCTDPA